MNWRWACTRANGETQQGRRENISIFHVTCLFSITPLGWVFLPILRITVRHFFYFFKNQ
ncbi:hypothetical protein [Roseovarius sp. ZX-A-9]|uniref:hypothetical protein n=1 Tax=Roseovarius sp. ZX-A-9 TaxID=3014783 RepID=UPI00232E7121|nr:hypothetical protein [Roseovarius sp. ZX-A-9]